MTVGGPSFLAEARADCIHPIMCVRETFQIKLGCLAQESGDGDGAKGHFNRILALDITYKDVAEKLKKLGA